MFGRSLDPSSRKMLRQTGAADALARIDQWEQDWLMNPWAYPGGPEAIRATAASLRAKVTGIPIASPTSAAGLAARQEARQEARQGLQTAQAEAAAQVAAAGMKLRNALLIGGGIFGVLGILYLVTKRK